MPRKPENNILLLLTWIGTLSTHEGSKVELDALCDWLISEDGWELYLHLVDMVQATQDIHQLILILIGIVVIRQFSPDSSDQFDEPINPCFLQDLDALLHDGKLGNSGRVAMHFAFAFAQILRCSKVYPQHLTVLLETTLQSLPRIDEERFETLLRVDYTCAAYYVQQRIKGADHDTAYKESTLQIQCSAVPNVPGESGPVLDDASGWVIVENPLHNPHNPKGFQVEILNPGNGLNKPKKGDTVILEYDGYLYDELNDLDYYKGEL